MSEAKSGEPQSGPLHLIARSESKPDSDTQTAQSPAARPSQRHPLWMWMVGGVLVALAMAEAVPWVIDAFRTVSTDDAYVNGHVTFVAPRVAGQVVHVLVDDNNRVHKGNLLVQLDKEPYRVKVDIAKPH